MAPADDDWIGVPAAARMLGLQLRTVHALIDRGDLAADVILPSPRSRSSRRSFRLRRRDVLDFIDQSRIMPGDLRPLYLPAAGYRTIPAPEHAG